MKGCVVALKPYEYTLKVKEKKSHYRKWKALNIDKLHVLFIPFINKMPNRVQQIQGYWSEIVLGVNGEF